MSSEQYFNKGNKKKLHSTDMQPQICINIFRILLFL